MRPGRFVRSLVVAGGVAAGVGILADAAIAAEELSAIARGGRLYDK